MRGGTKHPGREYIGKVTPRIMAQTGARCKHVGKGQRRGLENAHKLGCEVETYRFTPKNKVKLLDEECDNLVGFF